MGDWAQLYASLTDQLRAGKVLSFGQNFFVGVYQSFLDGDRWRLYLKGLGVTLEVTVLALILGVMEYFPAPLEKLVEQFARLPGIGGKSAQRLAFFVLSLPESEAREFADAIVDAKISVTLCPVCQNFTAGGLCPICSSQKRDGSVICVVADPRDVAALERAREFNGHYHGSQAGKVADRVKGDKRQQPANEYRIDTVLLKEVLDAGKSGFSGKLFHNLPAQCTGKTKAHPGAGHGKGFAGKKL